MPDLLALDVSTWDWVTISALATAAGTLVLAAATFAAVRSGNRAARNAERALLAGLRPLLFPSKLSDETLKVSFIDRHWLRVHGGQGAVDITDDVAYLAMSLRNVGHGMAVLHSWYLSGGQVSSADQLDHTPVESFRRLTRDLYVPPNDVFFWQGALRDRSDPTFDEVVEAARSEQPLRIEILYGDEEGGQRTVTRFSLVPHRTEDGTTIWLANVGRHWNLDRADPR